MQLITQDVCISQIRSVEISDAQARATHGAHEGTWFFEVTVAHLGATGHARLGWATDAAELQAPVRPSCCKHHRPSPLPPVGLPTVSFSKALLPSSDDAKGRESNLRSARYEGERERTCGILSGHSVRWRSLETFDPPTAAES